MEYRGPLPEVFQVAAEMRGGARRASPPWFIAIALVSVVVSVFVIQQVLTAESGRPAGAATSEITSRFEMRSMLGVFDWPADIATDARGWLYVSDKAGHTVTMFAADGRQVGVLGFGQPDLLQGPLGVTVDADGYVYVADITLKRIAVFDPGGAYSGDFGTKVFENSGRIPGALWVTETYLYVTDLGRHQVLVIDREGELERVIGAGQGNAVGELAYPNGIWVADDGVIWVSDTNNNRIQRFAADGTPLGAWGNPILSPRDLAVDSDGRVFVASALAHRVLILHPDGRRLQEIAGSRDAALRAPTGLALRGGQLYITDRLRGTVQEWTER